MLDIAEKKLEMLHENSLQMRAKDLHELLRAWENYHRLFVAYAHMKHIKFREETRYPGYYRMDFQKIDDENWKCFENSRLDRDIGEWNVFKVSHAQLIKPADDKPIGISNLGTAAQRARGQQAAQKPGFHARFFVGAGAPSSYSVGTRSLQLFDMYSYDFDSFRKFVYSAGFTEIFDIATDHKDKLLAIEDALLVFAFRFLNHVLYGQQKIPLKDDAGHRRQQRRADAQHRDGDDS